MELTLNKALNLKNKLAGEISSLQTKIRSNNSYDSRRAPGWDVKELMKTLDAKVNTLIRLKSAISLANTAINEKIFALAEAKSKQEFLRSLPTKEGVYTESSGFGKDSKDITYIATYSEVEVSKLLEANQDLIDDIQNQLNTHNHTYKFNFEV